MIQVVSHLVIGLFIAILQTSKLFMVLGMKYQPDLSLIYVILMALYSNVSLFWLLSVSIFIGIVVDALSGSLLISSLIYPIAVYIFVVFKKKILEFSFVIKLLLFIFVNIGYLLLNHLIIYIYSGLISGLSQKDIYIFLTNLLLFYTAYLLKVYVYEKTNQ